MKFKKAGWIHNTNVYEVNIRQYTKEGTFSAFEKELPRLKDMGVAVLWFMPVTPISQKEMKGTMGSYYACSDYTSINPEFGNMNDFKSLVKLAQGMGFKVIIDWVANHTGWDHVWTVTHPDYYKMDHNTNDFKKASGMDDIIELDFSNTELRKAMIAAMKFWIDECDIDGFRCDLAFWVELGFWLEAREALEKTKTLFWLAESDPIENPDYYQAFDACYCWTWMHKTEEFYKRNRDKRMLDDVLQQFNSVAGDENLVLWFTSNHDENSWNGSEYEKYGDAAKALAVFSCTWNGIPMVYSGQELPNYKRLAFFDKDPIEWTGEYALHNFYKTLLNLHKTNPALRGADPAVETHLLYTNSGASVMAFLRKNESHEVMVLLNFSDAEIDCIMYDDKIKGHYTNVFSNEVINANEVKHYKLPSWGYMVFEKGCF